MTPIRHSATKYPVKYGLLALLALAGPAARADDDPLIGIWMYQTSTMPGLRGELTVARTGDAWRATLSGVEVPFAVKGKDVRFEFPGGQGAFRGAPSGAAIDGFWLQPGGASYDPDDPGGTGEPFATPLALTPAAAGTWRGTVRPLEDRFTLYLKIDRGTDGALVAAFRNPELNVRGGASQFRVARTGQAEGEWSEKTVTWSARGLVARDKY
jgi:hypothetical protein